MPTDTEPARKRTRRAAEKAPADDAPKGDRGTEYVIMDQAPATAEGESAIRDALASGRVYIERPALIRASRGDEAIKLANRLPDGTHAPGTFKAVPNGTWNADANNLSILAETKVVNTFVKPGTAAAVPASPNGASGEE